MEKSQRFKTTFSFISASVNKDEASKRQPKYGMII